MDFNAALKNLEQTANAASNRSDDNNNNDNNSNQGGRGGPSGRSGRGGDEWREQDRGSSEHQRDNCNNDRERDRGGDRDRGGGGYYSRGVGSSSDQGGDRGYRGGGYNNDRRRGRDNSYSNYNEGRNTRPRFGNNHSHDGRSGGGGGGGGRGGRGYRDKPRPLDELNRLGYHVDAYQPPSELPSDLGTRPFHICLLAIIIDEMPLEHLWREWANNNENSHNSIVHVSLLVHAKYPEMVTSEFVKHRLIAKPPRMGRGNSYADPEYLSHKPEWGSIEITRAMIDLLRAGHKMGTPEDLAENDVRFASKRFLVTKHHEQNQDNKTTFFPPADKFVFISETCCPVQSLDECSKALFGDPDVYRKIHEENARKPPPVAGTGGESIRPATPWEVSWINGRNRTTPGTPRNKYEHDQFANIRRMIHGHYRWKADQWLCLSRPHASAVLAIDADLPHRHHLWKSAFCDISASDEMYFPCCLAVLQILDGRNDQVAIKAVTYTDWTEGMRNPATFCHGAKDLRKIAIKARQQGSLLARKFALRQSQDATVTGAISVEEWRGALEQSREHEAKVTALREEEYIKAMNQNREAEGAKNQSENQTQEEPDDSNINDNKHKSVLAGDEELVEETPPGETSASQDQEAQPRNLQ